MNISNIGLTITSCWRNGHATTHRSQVRGLARAHNPVLWIKPYRMVSFLYMKGTG